MSATTNSKLRLKNLLDKNEITLATFSTLQGARAAQVLARTGVDAVIVDCEHGHISDSEMHEMVVAISGSGVSPIVRIPGQSLMLIKRALDTGAHGIMIPTINTAEEARSMVEMAKFPPLGVRGQGSPFACFETGYATPSEYVANANANLLTMVQIESKAGVDNVDAICQVEGVDMLFIGPNDLALALLGYTPAKYTEPVFLEAIDKVVASAKKHGKKCGILAVDGEAAKQYKQTFDMVLLSNDVRSLQAWYRREMEIARS